MYDAPVALITGSAKRIGACTAKTLHAQGYRVIIHYHQSQSHAQNLIQQLNQQHANSCLGIQADLTCLSHIESFASQCIDLFGRLDVLVNNASAFYPTPIGDINQSHWHELIATNCQTPLFLAQALVSELKKNQGAIINMTDIHGQSPLSNHTVYSMAKAALISMTQSLAKELAPDIRVNGVSPGAILWPENPLNKEDKQTVLSQIPLRRLGRKEDIANTILFLIQSPYITGQIIAVDGGRSLGGQAKA
jgi:pteridine reductase